MATPYDNVAATVEDGMVIIRCRVADVQATISKSGKSMVYATTGGASPVLVDGRTLKLNLTLYEAR